MIRMSFQEIPTIIYGIILVFGGLIIGLIKIRKEEYKAAYGGFGHFIGALASFGLAYVVALEDSSKGIAIMIYYPIFSVIGILIGRKLGQRKDMKKRA